MTGEQSPTRAHDAKRVAGIDMGSNTTRLIVADVWATADGSLKHTTVERRTTITRLAEAVDRRGMLLPQAIARTRNALVEYRAAALSLGAVFALATATSAVRDADNGEAWLGEVEHDFGIRAVLLSGHDEARATWLGVTSDHELARQTSQGDGLLVDIGGGSTEIVLASNGQLADHHSFQVGSVRLSERFLHGDPPTRAQLQCAQADVRQALMMRFPSPTTPGNAIGVAGTVTTVAAIKHNLHSYDPAVVHLSRLSRRDVDECLTRLSGLALEQRRTVVGLEPERAPVIIGGLVTLACVLEHFGIGSLLASERDILDGIALMAGRIAHDEQHDALPQPFGRTGC